MNKAWGLALAAMAGAVLAACAAPPTAAPVSPAQTMAMIPTGLPVLRCRTACLQSWRAAQPEAAELLRRARWKDLAMLLVRIGYQDDLSLYYLGRAAQGMGYPDAAASYYRQSIALSGTSISCAALSRQCGGLVLPRAAELRLAALRRGPSRRRPAVARRPAAPEAATSHPAAATDLPPPAPPPEPAPLAPPPEPAPLAPPPEPVPPPAALPLAPPPAAFPLAPPPAAVAPARPPAPGASDFIEPPPAMK